MLLFCLPKYNLTITHKWRNQHEQKGNRRNFRCYCNHHSSCEYERITKTLKKPKKKKREASYVQAAAEFYDNIGLMGFVADLVLPQYSQAWSKAIDDRRDFNIAVNAKKNQMIQ